MKKLLNFIKKIFKKEEPKPTFDKIKDNLTWLYAITHRYNLKNLHLFAKGDFLLDIPFSILIELEQLTNLDVIRLVPVLQRTDKEFETIKDYLGYLLKELEEIKQKDL